MRNALTRLFHRADQAAAAEPVEPVEPAETPDTPEQLADADATSQAPKAARRGPHTRMRAWLGRPMTSFHLVIAVAALLTTLGLIMVLSASGVHSYDQDGSPWAIFGRQVLW